jgi:hypothetical protein
VHAVESGSSPRFCFNNKTPHIVMLLLVCCGIPLWRFGIGQRPDQDVRVLILGRSHSGGSSVLRDLIFYDSPKKIVR